MDVWANSPRGRSGTLHSRLRALQSRPSGLSTDGTMATPPSKPEHAENAASSSDSHGTLQEVQQASGNTSDDSDDQDVGKPDDTAAVSSGEHPSDYHRDVSMVVQWQAFTVPAWSASGSSSSSFPSATTGRSKVSQAAVQRTEGSVVHADGSSCSFRMPRQPPSLVR